MLVTFFEFFFIRILPASFLPLKSIIEYRKRRTQLFKWYVCQVGLYSFLNYEVQFMIYFGRRDQRTRLVKKWNSKNIVHIFVVVSFSSPRLHRVKQGKSIRIVPTYACLPLPIFQNERIVFTKRYLLISRSKRERRCFSFRLCLSK